MLFSFAAMLFFTYQLWTGTVPDDSEFFSSGMMPDPAVIKIGIVITFGLYVLPVLFNMHKVWELIKCLPHNIYFQPTYMHTLIIYAFARIDDLSWGTKGLEGA